MSCTVHLCSGQTPPANCTVGGDLPRHHGKPPPPPPSPPLVTPSDGVPSPPSSTRSPPATVAAKPGARGWARSRSESAAERCTRWPARRTRDRSSSWGSSAPMSACFPPGASAGLRHRRDAVEVTVASVATRTRARRGRETLQVGSATGRVRS